MGTTCFDLWPILCKMRLWSAGGTGKSASTAVLWTTLLRTVRLRASCASTASLPTILRPSAPLLRRVSATCVGLPSTSGMRVRSVLSLRRVRLRRTEEAEEEGAGVRGSSGATSAERTTIWSASATSTTPSWLLPKSPSHNCGQLGHIMSQCSEPERARDERPCHYCGQIGHLRRDCPALEDDDDEE